MIQLPQSLNAWNSSDFKDVLKQEVAQLDSSLLPLQQALSQSSYVSDKPVQLSILNTSENSASISIKAGIFYAGIIAGCSCADDPSPTDEITEYCEVLLEIDKKTAETRVILLADQAL